MRYLRAFTITLWPIVAWSQADDHYRKEPKMIYDLFQQSHYSPKVVDDVFSKKLFRDALYDMDEEGLLFLQKDVASLSRMESQLDDEFREGKWQFIQALSPIYRVRVQWALKVLDEIAVEPLKYNSKDSLYFNSSDSSFYSNEDALKSAWVRKVKYLTLWQLFYENTDKILSKEFNFAARELEARQIVVKRQRKKLQRRIASEAKVQADLCRSYFETFVHAYDPHSNYFSKDAWNEFFASLSSESYVFGFGVEENTTGALEVEAITPGGPAWKSNELHKKDIIKSLSLNGKAVDMEDMSAEEIDAMLAQADVRNLDVVVQKTDGSIKKVALTKEKIKTESNMIKSYVVDSNPKIGYIALPGFYVDADNKNGLGCANDVAKEIIRLKAEGIQGLVFDVRYNGGGAMREAQDLSGLFINEGPLFSIKDQNKTPILMKDLNRGTLFEGPMVVLVNGQSASASEIFASTLQDYNRAVLVGSTTYGKATGQSTHPIGVALDDPEANSRTHFNYGGVSVTRLKIYRLTGKSNQQVGLSPDISMPDLFEKLHVGERHYANALSKDETSKKPLFNALPTLPLTKLRESAYTRQQGHPAFIKLKDLIVQTPILLSKEKVVPVSLTLESMYPLVQEYKSWIASMATLSQTTPKVFTIHATTVDTQMAKLDIRYDEVQKQVIDDLERDLFIQESCHILLDLIKFTAK